MQFILLPYVFPSWHAGNGLFEGVDAPKFHRITVKLADEIEEFGWSEWELLPDGQLVSGVAAIFYVLIYPSPWSVLPVNGILNAFACVSIYLILLKLSNDKKKSLLCSLPFIFFPSNLLWNTQFHNENYVVPGVALILYGWVGITSNGENKKKFTSQENLTALLSIAIGSLLVGLVRSFILSGLSYLFIFIMVGFLFVWIISKFKLQQARTLLLMVMSLTIMLEIVFIINQKPSLNADFKLSGSLLDLLSTPMEEKYNERGLWEKTPWIPDSIESKIKSIARLRQKFIKSWAHGGSNIDTDIIFHNTKEVIKYSPRALQIAFFSPFPNLWFSEGKKEAGTTMRIVSTFEMLVIYFCLAGLPIYIWRNRHQPAVWVVVLVCTSILTVYALTIPNLGSLYRFRYPYLMPLVCFGLLGWFGSRIIKFDHPRAKDLH